VQATTGEGVLKQWGGGKKQDSQGALRCSQTEKRFFGKKEMKSLAEELLKWKKKY